MDNTFECDNCGIVTLSPVEMMEQLRRPDSAWCCPTCRGQLFEHFDNEEK